MADKQYKYTAKFTQPQKVGAVKLNPNGGILTEKDLKAVRKDVYGASLLDKGLLVVTEAVAEAKPVLTPAAGKTSEEGNTSAAEGAAKASATGSEIIPSFDNDNEG